MLDPVDDEPAESIGERRVNGVSLTSQAGGKTLRVDLQERLSEDGVVPRAEDPDPNVRVPLKIPGDHRGEMATRDAAVAVIRNEPADVELVDRNLDELRLPLSGETNSGVGHHDQLGLRIVVPHQWPGEQKAVRATGAAGQEDPLGGRKLLGCHLESAGEVRQAAVRSDPVVVEVVVVLCIAGEE